MKAVDKQGKGIGRFNAIDLLIFIFLVVVVGFVALEFTADQDVSYVRETRQFKMEVLLRELSEGFPEELEIGEKIYDQNSHKCLGTLTNKEVENTIAVLKTEDGSYVETEYPNLYDVVITIEGEGSYNERTGLMVGDEIRFIGNAVTINNDLLLDGGTIIGLEVFTTN